MTDVNADRNMPHRDLPTLTLGQVKATGRFAYAASAEAIPFRFYPERQHRRNEADTILEVEFLRPDNGYWYSTLVHKFHRGGHEWCFWKPEQGSEWDNIPCAVLGEGGALYTFTVPAGGWHHLPGCDCEFCYDGEEATT